MLLKIIDVNAYLLKVPYPDGQRFSAAWEAASTKEFTFTLVEVETDEGITGYSGMISKGFEIISFIESAVKEFLSRIPFDPFFIEMMTRPLRTGSYFGPRVGLIDIALWDIVGKALKQPIYKLMGATKPMVKAYMSTGQIKKTQQHIKDFEEAKAKYGFKAVKFRFHRGRWEDDIKVLKEFRDTFPMLK